MSNKCSFRLADGRFCKRWALRGQGFCVVHQPDPPKDQHGCSERYPEHDVSVPPLARLATPRDLFDVVRESINAVRLGRMSPGQAYAISALVSAWIHARKEVGYSDSRRVLRSQMLPALSEEERVAEDELESSPAPVPPAPSPSSASLPSSEVSNLPSPTDSAFPPLPRDPRVRPGMTMDEIFDALSAPPPGESRPSSPSPPSSPASSGSSEISDLKSAVGTSPREQVDLVAAHKAFAEKMGWPPDDGSDLQPHARKKVASPG